jgi:L-galactose dehydrogenase
MRYRTLGNTGVSISVIGFGGSPLGNVFGEISSSGDSRLIGAAIDNGINFFDVSPYYGLGLAEERLGTALASYRREVVLATKCGRYGADEFDFSAHGITTRLEASLRRLRTDAVDLLQAHDIEFGDADQVIHETFPALAELKRQGKTRFIGATGYWPDLLARMLQSFPLDSVLNYCHWNLFADDMDAFLTPVAKVIGTGLINASPLHMGLLGGGPAPEWHPAPQGIRHAAHDVVSICREKDVDPATLAVWKCLQHPTAASTLVGMADVSQVASSCAALDFQPDENLLKAITELIDPVRNTSWPQGRPENQDRAPGQNLAITELR